MNRWGIFGVMLAGGLALSACGGNGGSLAAPATSGGSGTTATTSPTTTSPTKPHVGTTVAVTDPSGNREGVTLVRVVDPATPGQVNTITPGNQYVGVELKVANTGTTTFEPNPDNATTVLDAAGHQYQVDIGNLSDCPAFDNLARLTPGDTIDGCVTFQVPSGTSIAKVQFSPLTAESSQTAEWLVP